MVPPGVCERDTSRAKWRAVSKHVIIIHFIKLNWPGQFFILYKTNEEAVDESWEARLCISFFSLFQLFTMIKISIVT